MTAKFYECKVDLPALDGEGVERVTLLLKPMALLPAGVVRKHRHDDTELFWAMFEWGVSAEQMDLFDRIPRGPSDSPRLRQIMDDWQEAEDGVTPGESEASSTSPTGTGRRSKQTSSGSDSG